MLKIGIVITDENKVEIISHIDKATNQDACIAYTLLAKEQIKLLGMLTPPDTEVERQLDKE